MDRSGASQPSHGIELQSPTARENNTYDSTMSATSQYSTMAQSSTTTTNVTQPAPAWERPDYSDLEVCHVVPPTWDNDKMAVVADPDDKNRHFIGASPISPSAVTDPVPAYSPHLSTAASQLPLNTKGEYAEWNNQRDMPPVKRERVFCGVAMSKKRLSILGVGVLAFILILLATVLGITLTMNIVSRGEGEDPKTVTSAVNHLLLNNSGLAALNWTDGDSGADMTAVFYQDRNNAIMAAIRDSVSNRWIQSNVTAAVMNATGSSGLDVLSGTPMAAVTNTYQVSLYYLKADKTLAELYASDILEHNWVIGSLSKSLSPLTSFDGSHLAAYWHLCGNCTQSLYVAFQDDSGSVQMANLTNDAWAFASVPVDLAPLKGTGLSVRPFTEDNGAGKFKADTVGLRMFAFDNSGLRVSKDAGPAGGYSWSAETASTTLNTTIANDTSPELAAITYGDHGLTNSLVNYLTPEGKFMTYLYNGTVWTSGTPKITDGQTNYTAISTAQNLRVYATSNGSIYEYQVDKKDPLTWAAMSVVMAS